MRRNPNSVVLVPDELLTGTPVDNVRSILRHGLLPGKGQSGASFTRTKDALFFTDSMEGALLYTGSSYDDAYGEDAAAIVSVNPRGLSVQPDYDDFDQWGEVNEILLSLASGVGGRLSKKPAPGEVLSESDAEKAQRWLESEEFNGPPPISIEETEAGPVLYISPWVRIPVERPLDDEDIGDLYWDNGEPYLVIRQYMCRCTVGRNRINGVWLNVNAITVLKEDFGLSLPKPQKSRMITHYNAPGHVDFRMHYFPLRDVRLRP